MSSDETCTSTQIGCVRLAPSGAITQGAVQAVRLGSFADSVRPGTGERVWPVSVVRPSGSRVCSGKSSNVMSRCEVHFQDP
jgi:hypothetical protein